MEITSSTRGRVLVLSIRGDIDALTADALTSEIKARIAEGHINLVMDLNQVVYVSSMGLRSLINAVKESRSCGGDFLLANVQGSIKRVIKLSGLTTIVKVFADVDAAVRSFDRQAG